MVGMFGNVIDDINSKQGKLYAQIDLLLKATTSFDGLLAFGFTSHHEIILELTNL